MRNILKKKETIEITGCDHVQHAWLNSLDWKMQTVINQGMRAPDTHFCKGMKIVCRWIRTVVLQNADKDHTFMCSKIKLPSWEDLDNEINYCSVHFATHFLYALEIIAYKHPEPKVKQKAMILYQGIVHYQMHFNPETQEQLDIRLADVDRTPKIKECPKDESKDRYIS